MRGALALCRDRSLATQCLWLGGLVALTLGGLGHLLWASEMPSAGLLAAGSAGLASVALAGLVKRTARTLGVWRELALTLQRSALAGEQNFAAAPLNADVKRLVISLQRMVNAGRERIRALESQNAELGQRLDLRTNELNALQALSINLAKSKDLSSLVDDALVALDLTMDCSSLSVWAREGLRAGAPVGLLGCRSPNVDDEQLRRLRGKRLSRESLKQYKQVESERLPLIENNSRQNVLSWLWALVTDDSASSALHTQTRSWIALPLQSRHEVVGVLRIDHAEPGFFDAERSRQLEAMAAQTALAMRHAELMSREREVAVVAERSRIARDLHDAVSQTLFAANVVAGTLAKQAGQVEVLDAAGVELQARTLERLSRAALAEMRLLMLELRPDALEQTPLADLLLHAVEALSIHGDVKMTTSLARGETLNGEVRIELYRIAQEALSNIARHSRASEASVLWKFEADGSALLQIADNGVGMGDAVSAPGHFGLENMRTRAQAIGAHLDVESAAGSGTRLMVQLRPGKLLSASAAALAPARSTLPS